MHCFLTSVPCIFRFASIYSIFLRFVTDNLSLNFTRHFKSVVVLLRRHVTCPSTIGLGAGCSTCISRLHILLLSNRLEVLIWAFQFRTATPIWLYKNFYKFILLRLREALLNHLCCAFFSLNRQT